MWYDIEYQKNEKVQITSHEHDTVTEHKVGNGIEKLLQLTDLYLAGKKIGGIKLLKI